MKVGLHKKYALCYRVSYCVRCSPSYQKRVSVCVWGGGVVGGVCGVVWCGVGVCVLSGGGVFVCCVCVVVCLCVCVCVCVCVCGCVCMFTYFLSPPFIRTH